MGCLVQGGNGIELEAVGLQFEPYRWRPCGVTWDSSRTVMLIKLWRTSALTVGGRLGLSYDLCLRIVAHRITTVPTKQASVCELLRIENNCPVAWGSPDTLFKFISWPSSEPSKKQPPLHILCQGTQLPVAAAEHSLLLLLLNMIVPCWQAVAAPEYVPCCCS